jgi:hypothetical protein
MLQAVDPYPQTLTGVDRGVCWRRVDQSWIRVQDECEWTGRDERLRS